MFVPIVLPLESQNAALVQEHTTRYWLEAAFLALRSELPRPPVGQSVASRAREGR
ncbi:hypothetical protein SDC9_134794 [bioreactor metagenome]|uniref:Uncharacterized protein n=1 Tax=bioreactor metagenome TaxID=1076179 RepID=A0A645DE59_9ZZZZ